MTRILLVIHWKLKNIFIEGVKKIRTKESEVAEYTEEQYEQNLEAIRKKVAVIVEGKTRSKG